MIVNNLLKSKIIFKEFRILETYVFAFFSHFSVCVICAGMKVMCIIHRTL